MSVWSTYLPHQNDDIQVKRREVPSAMVDDQTSAERACLIDMMPMFATVQEAGISWITYGFPNQKSEIDSTYLRPEEFTSIWRQESIEMAIATVD
ncbi:hypothetical protein AWV79_25595 [Cupriavidus sp. UYMMa02A]|nr:hypothetical protein AWV79_25595 [Cupriavidus sp. UYMMa02A]